MPIVESTLAALPRDPRLEAQLADHATGVAPAWLWSADGSRMLWANAVGAAIFGAANSGECAARAFDIRHPAAAEIARLATTLPASGQARLERLRGFGGGFGRALTCVCSRMALADGAAAVLLVATEPAGPSLPLRERVGRLFAGRAAALAAFTSDGTLLYATPAAGTRLAEGSTLSALGLTGLASQALAAGRADGATAGGAVSVGRLGRGEMAVLVAQFDDVAAAAGDTEPVAARPTETAVSPVPPTADGAEAMPHGVSGRTEDDPAAERRQPLRFVWQMDADGRFVVGSDEFIELMGPRTTAAFGRLWSEIAAELGLDPDNQVARAVATHETWSGITVSWPVDDGGERLPVELSGLPVFDRDRGFHGYRGFGVCRELDRINRLVRARRERPIGMAPLAAPAPSQPQAPAATDAEDALPPAEPAAAEQTTDRPERPSLNVVPAAANVVPFRGGATPEPKPPALSPVERNAFRELAEELTARLQGVRDDLAAADGARGPSADSESRSEPHAGEPAQPLMASEPPPPPTGGHGEADGTLTTLLDRLPLGILIYRHDRPNDTVLYANRYFLELSGYPNMDALMAGGGLEKLFAEPRTDTLTRTNDIQTLSIANSDGSRRPVEGRLLSVPWVGAPALALLLTNGEAEERRRAHAVSLSAAQGEIRELKARVETFKKTEADMRAATREAQKAAAINAEFVNKISHEIRTPLNAITGFAEVMMAERFGPLGNERYRDYLKDIHTAGVHVVSLLNDLLDLSKVENEKLDLSFANVSLNELTQQCVGIMQPQASRARIIIRTSLTPGLPQVVADERSLRQIVLNLLSNSIQFTGPGGQVIVSTAFADSGEAVLRVRDTGVGMSEKDVEAVLEPFRQTATSAAWGSGGTGLGLPLTKALAEANRAHFSIKSAPNAGTLVEVAFPPARVAR
jgi:signal transduction histidine kinase